MTEPSKPVRDTLYHWSRFSCAGGLGWSIHGELADGSLFQTGTIYAEHKDGDEEKCGDRWGWAETLTWRYILHGEQVWNPSDVYLKSARNREIPVYVLGCNADGSPIHSLARGTNRVPDDVTLQEWKL